MMNKRLPSHASVQNSHCPKTKKAVKICPCPDCKAYMTRTTQAEFALWVKTHVSVARVTDLIKRA